MSISISRAGHVTSHPGQQEQWVTPQVVMSPRCARVPLDNLMGVLPPRTFSVNPTHTNHQPTRASKRPTKTNVNTTTMQMTCAVKFFWHEEGETYLLNRWSFMDGVPVLNVESTNHTVTSISS